MQPPTNNSDLVLPPGDLQFVQQVGAGGYAEVWKGKWRGKGGGIIVAIKKVPVNKLNPRQQREILVEVGIHFICIIICFSLRGSICYAFVLFVFMISISFDLNHTSSPSSGTRTFLQSSGHASLRKQSSG